MAMQVKVSTRVAEGERTLDLGTAHVRVQTKATVQVFVDGKMVPQENWQDQQVRPLANEEGLFALSAGQRLIIEEGK